MKNFGVKVIVALSLLLAGGLARAECYEFCLDLDVSVFGSGSVSSSPTGIACPGDCIEAYGYGTQLTLTATPGSGYSFSGWSGACSGTSTCDVDLIQDESVVATFVSGAPDLVVTGVVADASGEIGGQLYVEEHFKNIGQSASGQVLAKIFYSTDQMITAADIDSGKGCVVGPLEPQGTFTCSGPITVENHVPPGTYYMGVIVDFEDWVSESNEGNNSGAAAQPTVISGSGLPLSVTISGSGSVTSSPSGIQCPPDCSESYSHGTIVTLTAVPTGMTSFSGWSGACGGSGTTCQVTMSAAKSVRASFVEAAKSTTSDVGEGTDSPWLSWSTGGAKAWVIQEKDAVVGGDAMQTQTLPDNQASELRTTVAGPGWVRFWWMVSSQSERDFLRFYVDGEARSAVSGEVDWTQEVFALGPGNHDLVWAYEKDGSGSGGRDAAWVDGVEVVQSEGYQVSLDLPQDGGVVSSPGGIDCVRSSGVVIGTCEAQFPAGEQILLMPLSDGSNALTSWSGGGCSGNGLCAFALTSDTDITATFSPLAASVLGEANGQTREVNVRILGRGGVSSSPQGIECTGNGGIGGSLQQGLFAGVCRDSFLVGETIELSANPAANYQFRGWVGPCSGGGNSCSLNLPDSDQNLTALFVPQTNAASVALTLRKFGTGVVQSSSGSISCGESCTQASQNFAPGTQISLTASGGDFAGWGGACSGTGPCNLTLRSPQELTATFRAAGTTQFPLSVDSMIEDDGGAQIFGAATASVGGVIRSIPPTIDCGGGSTACSGSFLQGQQVLLIAEANPGYRFVRWEGACTGSSPLGCRVTLMDVANVTAVFAPIAEVTFTTHSLNVSTQGQGQGLVQTTSAPGTPPAVVAGISCGMDCLEEYGDGEQVYLKATPLGGSTFSGWGGACAGTQSTCNVTMDAAKSVTASFAPPIRHSLNVTIQGQGQGLVQTTSAPGTPPVVVVPGISCGTDCVEEYSDGEQVYLRATALGDSTFSSWGGACAGTQSTCNLTMNGSKSVTASFVAPVNPASGVTYSYTGTDCGAFINAQADKLERQQARIYNPVSNPRSLWVICPLAAPIAAGGSHSGAVPGAWSFIDGRVSVFWNTGAADGSRVDCAIRQYGFDNTHLPGVSQAGVLSVTTLASMYFAAAGPPYVEGVDFALPSPQGGFNYMTASCLLPPGAGINGIEVEFGAAP